MSAIIHRKGIAQSFSAASNTYDHWAKPQRAIAEDLSKLLPDELPDGSILDVGCGTGLLTEMLLDRYPGRALLGIDVAPGMIDHCRKRWARVEHVRFEVADGEDFSSKTSFALIASNCCFQWFQAIDASMAHLSAMLAPGGWFVASAPVEGTRHELDDSYHVITDEPFPSLPFHASDDYMRPLREQGLVIVEERRDTVEAMYSNALEVLKSFKGVGATLEYQDGYKPLAPNQLRRLLQEYERRYGRADGSVPVTYETLLFAGKKPVV